MCFFSPMLSAPTARIAWPTPYNIPMYKIVRYLPEIHQFFCGLSQFDNDGKCFQTMAFLRIMTPIPALLSARAAPRSPEA